MIKEINNYLFVCDTFANSRNWGHKGSLYAKENRLEPIARDKIIYYNRTWESYEYQSLMFRLVNNAMQNIYNRLLDNYKYDNNIKRLTKDKKEYFENQILRKDKQYNELVKVYRQI